MLKQAEEGFAPPSLLARPIPPDDLIPVLDAFWVLAESRIVGFGMSPILLSEISAYFDLYGRPDDVDYYVTLIRAMDSEYLSLKLKQSEAKPIKGLK